MDNKEMSFEEFNGKCRKSKVYNAAMDSLREEIAGLFESNEEMMDEAIGEVE